MQFLNRVKKSLGRQCSFLAFSTDKIKNEDGSWSQVDCVKAILENDEGGKDTVVMALDKKPLELKEEDYNNLFFVLNSRTYNGGN